MTHRHAIMKHVPTLKVPKFEDIYDNLNSNYSIYPILNTSFCIIIFIVSKGGFYLIKTSGSVTVRKDFITVNSSCEEVKEDEENFREKFRKNYDDVYQQIQDWYRELYDELLKGAGC